jgi:hypothetical protein
MRSWVDTAAAALISGTAASLAMTAALALLAKKEGKGALQPINSTSHWLHGEQASLTRSLVCPILDWGSEHIMFRHYSGHLFLRDGSQLGRDVHPCSCLETNVDHCCPSRLRHHSEKIYTWMGRGAFEALHGAKLCSNGPRFNGRCNVEHG